MKKRWLTDAEQREVFDFLKNKPDSVKTRELLEFALNTTSQKAELLEKLSQLTKDYNLLTLKHYEIGWRLGDSETLKLGFLKDEISIIREQLKNFGVDIQIGAFDKEDSSLDRQNISRQFVGLLQKLIVNISLDLHSHAQKTAEENGFLYPLDGPIVTFDIKNGSLDPAFSKADEALLMSRRFCKLANHHNLDRDKFNRLARDFSLLQRFLNTDNQEHIKNGSSGF